MCNSIQLMDIIQDSNNVILIKCTPNQMQEFVINVESNLYIYIYIYIYVYI
jgi:hypothetical protein